MLLDTQFKHRSIEKVLAIREKEWHKTFECTNAGTDSVQDHRFRKLEAEHKTL